MASLNRVTLIGNLGADPEVRYTQSREAIATIRIATTETYKDKSSGERKEITEWHRVVFFGRTAEVVGEYLKKGSPVYVEGRIQTRKWQDKDGQDRYVVEILANDMKMLGSRPADSDALRDCVAMGNFKYAVYTDKIYLSIFREKAQEYRKVLRLEQKDCVRSTFYSEVLDLISSYECGLGDVIRQEFDRMGRKLSAFEVDAVFKRFDAQAHWKPLIEKARLKMASRDLAFRDALHLQLKEYVAPVQREDYERFLGEKSKELSERLEEAKDVMKRLKDRS